MRILTIFGTRPEVIKMAPVIAALKQVPDVVVGTCVTAQHRYLLDQMLDFFGIIPDYDLDVMEADQTLTGLTAKLVATLEQVIVAFKPDYIMVQGDTTTTFVAALAAFYQKVPVAHIEAGLRTGEKYSPWPEEINRKLTTTIADIHFAPTQWAAQNLLNENIDPASIEVTGNTVIDALVMVEDKLDSDNLLRDAVSSRFSFLSETKKTILVTHHRRESFGEEFNNVCRALIQLAGRDDVQVIYPVHLNPHVQDAVHKMLEGKQNIFLLEPLDYVSLVFLLRQTYLVLTDSGGIQEEAPHFGVPVCVMRDLTERPEAVEAGTAKIVGTKTDDIVLMAETLLDNPQIYQTMSVAHNPYGDGYAAKRIVERMVRV